VAFDGTNIWVSCSGSVVKLQAATGSLLGTFSEGGPYGVAFDGANIWVSNIRLGTVSKL
jgi:DNA-binding beta-propeller fold protein YncE